MSLFVVPNISLQFFIDELGLGPTDQHSTDYTEHSLLPLLHENYFLIINAEQITEMIDYRYNNHLHQISDDFISCYKLPLSISAESRAPPLTT